MTSRIIIRWRLLYFLVIMLAISFNGYSQQTYRLLVVYTPSAASAIGASNVKAWVEAWMVNEVNTIYANSADPSTSPVFRVELAGIDSVNYTEVSQIADLTALENGTGPFLRVAELRRRYSADVVMLVANKSGYSGMSYTWATIVGSDTLSLYGDANTYFASIVQYDYVVNRYTSAHETGHLMAPNHATWDPAWKSFWLYAHGWGSRPPSNTWGTVMCYNLGRQAFYSNPDNTYNGNSCGRADSADNARAIIENPSGVNSWRVTPSDTVIQSDTLTSQMYGDVLATNTISTNSAVLVKGQLKLRATNKVTINSGFSVGSSGSLLISSGSGALSKKSFESDQHQDFNAPAAKVAPAVTSFNVFAGKKSFRIDYSLAKECEVRYSLYELDGKSLLSKSLGKQLEGKYSRKIGLPNGSSRILVLVLRAGNVVFRQALRCQ